MADAYVRLGLDPSGVVAGGRAAIAGLDPFVRRVQAMPAALRPVSGAVDGLTARYRTLGRAARGAFGEQIAAARRAGSTLQAEGRKAGAAFGTTLAAGIRSRSGAAASAAARVMSDIAAYLPQAGSGARRGPLANLPRSGRAIPEVLAVGVRRGTPTLRAAVAAMTAQARAQLAAGLRPPAGAAGAGRASRSLPWRRCPARSLPGRRHGRERRPVRGASRHAWRGGGTAGARPWPRGSSCGSGGPAGASGVGSRCPRGDHPGGHPGCRCAACRHPAGPSASANRRGWCSGCPPDRRCAAVATRWRLLQ